MVGEQRDKLRTDEDDTTAEHQLLHALVLMTVGIEKFSIKHCKTGTAS